MNHAIILSIIIITDDNNSLALLQSNAQSSCRYVHSQIKDRSLLSGELLALKAQRQGGSIKNLLKPSLPNQSSVGFSGSLGFKNLGRITTGSTVDKKRIHICWLCFLQNCYINNMISVKILDKINYFEFTGVDSRSCFRWRLRIPSSAAPRNEKYETIGFGFAFHWLRTYKPKSDLILKQRRIQGRGWGGCSPTPPKRNLSSNVVSLPPIDWSLT